MGFEVALLAASTALTVGGTIASSNAQAASFEYERQAAEEQAKEERLAALQEEASRRDQLKRTLATQQAQAAAGGYDPFGSRSFLAIQDEERSIAESDVRNIQLMGASRVRQLNIQAKGAAAAARSARTVGWIGAGQSLLTGAYTMRQAGLFRSSSSGGGSVVRGASYGTGPGRL